jgi:transcriptional regulator GlxA family with amidase domain
VLVLCGVEVWRSGLGGTYLLPTLSVAGASLIPPSLSLRRLKKRSDRGVAVASVCSGVGLVAATGLLDGKRATTHWGLAERFRQKYPRVKWMPELMVTEDRGFYCGGGVNASLDLSISSGREILWPRNRHSDRESAAYRNPARLAVGVRHHSVEDRP